MAALHTMVRICQGEVRGSHLMANNPNASEDEALEPPTRAARIRIQAVTEAEATLTMSARQANGRPPSLHRSGVNERQRSERSGR